MDRGGGEAIRAAAESAAKEEAASGKPLRIDVSKLANFRYSNIKVFIGGREEPDTASNYCAAVVEVVCSCGDMQLLVRPLLIMGRAAGEACLGRT